MKTKGLISLVATFFVSCFQSLHAQDAAGVKIIVEEQTHPLVWIILAVMLGLLVAIFYLSKLYLKVVTKNLSKVTAILVPMLLLASTAFGEEAAVPFKTQVVYLPISTTTAFLAALGIGLEVLVIIFFVFKLTGFLKKLNVVETTPSKEFNFSMPKFWDNLNASVALEKEKDIEMEHEYDGIRELDNNLPPWWKYSFYISIVWAVLYFGYYHMGGDGESSIASYEHEMAQAKIEKAAIAKLMASKVDENNVAMADAGGIIDGSEIFKTNCAACHGTAGEGSVGPNLTDKFWIHGGDLTSVYKLIKVGAAEKGMKSWEAELSSVQIKNVASYIKTLGGTNPPNPKAPQGEEYVEGGATSESTAGAASTDTSSNVKTENKNDLANK